MNKNLLYKLNYFFLNVYSWCIGCINDNNFEVLRNYIDLYTVDPIYLELGYLEPPLISNKSPGPVYFYLYKSYEPRLCRTIFISNTFWPPKISIFL